MHYLVGAKNTVVVKGKGTRLDDDCELELADEKGAQASRLGDDGGYCNFRNWCCRYSNLLICSSHHDHHWSSHRRTILPHPQQNPAFKVASNTIQASDHEREEINPVIRSIPNLVNRKTLFEL